LRQDSQDQFVERIIRPVVDRDAVGRFQILRDVFDLTFFSARPSEESVEEDADVFISLLSHYPTPTLSRSQSLR
jgi:hypothetical protein